MSSGAEPESSEQQPGTLLFPRTGTKCTAATAVTQL